MGIIVEICGFDNSEVKNTGASKQCLEGATVRYALAKKNFTFDSKEDFKNKLKWNEAKKNKDIIPFFSIEASELSNTEATYYEGRTVKIQTKAARKGLKFKHNLGLCSHSALKSFQSSEYLRVFEFTEKGYVKGVNNNGKVKGQLLREFIVGIRQEPVIGGDPETSNVELVFADFNEFENNGIIAEPNFDLNEFEGIYPVRFEVIGTPTATKIVVEAMAGCGRIPVNGLVLTDFKLLKADKTPQAIIGVTPNENNKNTYTINGTGFVTGTIATSVVEQTNIMYQAEPVAIII